MTITRDSLQSRPALLKMTPEIDSKRTSKSKTTLTDADVCYPLRDEAQTERHFFG